MAGKSSKASKAKPSTAKLEGPRMLKKPSYKSFRLHKKIKPHQPILIPGRKIIGKSFAIFKARPKTYFGILAVYLVLSLILVKGFATSLNIPELKGTLFDLYNGAGGKAISTVALFGVLLGSNTGSSEILNSGIYQSIITIMVSLALLWTLRYKPAKNNSAKLRVRDGFYNGMYPIVPLLIVMAVFSLQMIPLAIGSWLYNVVIAGGIAVTAVEQFAWILLILLLAVASLYMISSSLFAMIIVTLPGITPMRALRSAREVVRHRRWTVIRKLLFLGLAILLLNAVILAPFIIWLPVLAEWMFFILSGASWIISVTYLYVCYKEMLK